MVATIEHKFKNLIDNEFCTPSSREVFVRSNPAHHNDIVVAGTLASVDDIHRTVACAERAAPIWAAKSIQSRIKVITKALNYLETQIYDLSIAVTRENGKPIAESTAECKRAIDAARQNIKFFEEMSQATRTQVGEAQGVLLYEPLGTALLITPWNFPVATVLRKLIPALLCGNSVILKPSEFTPVSAQLICAAFIESEIEPGVINLIAGGATVGRTLIEIGAFGALSFTGSTTVGLEIAKTLSNGQTRTQLELGGKNPLVVCEDANLEAAADAVLSAGMTCSGQWCVGTSRILVDRKVYEIFIELVLTRLLQIRVGDGIDPATTMGPLINQQQFEKVLGFLNRVSDDGGEIQLGGPMSANDRQGWFVAPTLVTDTPINSALWMKEIFGPVLAMRSFKTLDESIMLCNDSEYGLTASVFTQSKTTASTFLSRVNYGRVSVNTSTGLTHPLLPHGGRRQSGRGEPENGWHGIRFFSQHKSAYVAGLDLDSIMETFN